MPRKCSVCKKPGHNKATCQEKNMLRPSEINEEQETEIPSSYEIKEELEIEIPSSSEIKEEEKIEMPVISTINLEKVKHFISEIKEEKGKSDPHNSPYYKLGDPLYICTLCTEEMIDNDRIICPYCSVEICEPCFQYSLTMELRTPHCIYCKKHYTIEFILSNNATKWCKKTFLPYLGNLLLEMEMKKIPQFMEHYKMLIQWRTLKQEYTLLRKKINKNRGSEEWANQVLTLNQQIYDLENKIYSNDMKTSNKKKEKKIVFIMPCPMENCKGYISDKYVCQLCDQEICNACHQAKSNSNEHQCKRDDIKSATIIKESSKPCPNCYVAIFKISGCNQMFCTHCHIVFDWETLEIDKGAVHNVHYFEWITSTQNNALTQESMACGNIEDVYQALKGQIHHLYHKYGKKDDYLFYSFNGYVDNIFFFNRVVHGELIPYYNGKIENCDKYILKYLDDALSEKSWKQKLISKSLQNEFITHLIQILEVYELVSADFLRQLSFQYEKLQEYSFVKEKLQEFASFKTHFDNSLDTLCNIFGKDVNKIIDHRSYQTLTNRFTTQNVTLLLSSLKKK
jgi:hypothetical protein